MKKLLLTLILITGLLNARIIDINTLAYGLSMYPLLVPGQEYYVKDTPYEELKPGMLVKFEHQGKRVVHMLKCRTLRNRWVTTGINKYTNPWPDKQPMGKEDYIGEVLLQLP